MTRSDLEKRIRELIAECDETFQENTRLQERVDILAKYNVALQEHGHKLFWHNQALTTLLQTELEMRHPVKEK